MGGETEWVYYIPRETDPTFITPDNVEDLFWHREDGPASMWYYTSYRKLDKKCTQWMHNNLLHRYDGPAEDFYKFVQIKSDGTAEWEWLRSEWYLYGNPINSDDYTGWMEDMGMDINNLTPEDKVIIDLKWKIQ